MGPSLHLFLLIASMAITVTFVGAWMRPLVHSVLYGQARTRMFGDEGGGAVEWGISFIGQDVCGSKYNDDPFTAMEGKPDAWTEFKKRVDALANSTSANATTGGRWP